MFLVDVADVGGRLQYVHINSRCGEIDSTGSVLVTAFNVPDSRAVDAEMGFLLSCVGGWVAGIAGQHESGRQWMAIIQMVPAGAKAQAVQVRDGAIAITGVERIQGSYLFAADEIIEYCGSVLAEGDEDLPPRALSARLAGLRTVPLSLMLKGFAVELTGYPLSSVIANDAVACGFPHRDHFCHGSVVDDVMNDWLERGAARGT